MFKVIDEFKKKIYSGNDYSFLDDFLIIKLLTSIQQNFFKKKKMSITKLLSDLFIIYLLYWLYNNLFLIKLILYYLIIFNILIVLLVLTYISIIIVINWTLINIDIILDGGKITDYLFSKIINNIEIQFDLIEEKICFDKNDQPIWLLYYINRFTCDSILFIIIYTYYSILKLVNLILKIYNFIDIIFEKKISIIYYSLCFIILLGFVSILGVPLRLLVFLLYLLDTLADPYAIIIHLPGYIENELIKDIIKNDKYKIWYHERYIFWNM